jgi:CBS domain containing-hemolysin-like protein
MLGRAMDDSTGLLLSILIGNNLTHYLVTSIVTIFLLSKLGAEHTAELFATLITAPILFVFAELLPKNIFFYRADFLMPCVAPILFSFKTLLTWCGMVPVLKFVSRIFARLIGSPRPSETAITAVRQSHIRTVLRETREEGFLSPVQTDIMNRLASISHLSVKSVMTPIGKAQTVDSNFDNSTLLRKLKKSAFTRLPVYEHHPANIVGFINIYDCLSSPEQFTDLPDFIKPIRKLGADTVVAEAINIMQSENQKIVLITRVGHAGRERPIGIVTMKDLVEELLGELADW